MKIVSKTTFFCAIIALFTLAISCNNNDDNETKELDKSITGILKGNQIFSTLLEAIEITELTETLKNQEPYTIFAPTNTAFSDFLKTTTYTTISEVPKDVLKQILLNHVLTGSFDSKKLTTGYVKTLATSASSGDNKMSMYILNLSTPSAVTLRVNGIANVFKGGADIIATNGVIHAVDKIINLPTIVTHVQANGDLKTLLSLLTKVGQPDFVTTLSGVGPFTVFAPTDVAFTSLNTELRPLGLAGISDTNLTKVLQYHVTNDSFLASSLTEGKLINTLETPQKFEIQLTGGPKIKDVRNRISSITVTDIQCSNGILHVIDKVLLPTF